MGRLVRIAGNGEIALQHLPRLVGKAGAVRGPGEEALGDLAGAAPADAGDARDREDVLHEGLGRLGRLAFDGGEQARMLLGTRPVLFGEARQALSRDDGADHATLGGRRNPESIDQGIEQAHIAELHDGRGAAELLRGLQARGPGSPHPRPRRPARPMDSRPACRNSPLSPVRMRKTGPP